MELNVNWYWMSIGDGEPFAKFKIYVRDVLLISNLKYTQYFKKYLPRIY